MSDIADIPTTGTHPGPRTEPAAHEAYAFACMRCGYGWEQAYEIEHHIDATGATHVVYYADGERVPSPLTSPKCGNCTSNVVRIMRAGRVSTVSHAMESMYQRHTGGAAKKPAGGTEASTGAEQSAQGAGSTAAESAEDHHWHLSDLLHPFQHHHRK
ncbi:hypothetical protein [Streptomyces sp. NPDC048644]|uniref:hypothetical protein n=1 Tax=Streptomyces sp. NPDC048644 TaxID=3365582 RepID=UPI0037245473